MKLPYDSIFVQAHRLFTQIAYAKTRSQIEYSFKIYFAYLEGCGWTDKEFEAELLIRIDSNWDPNENPKEKYN